MGVTERWVFGEHLVGKQLQESSGTCSLRGAAGEPGGKEMSLWGLLSRPGGTSGGPGAVPVRAASRKTG